MGISSGSHDTLTQWVGCAAALACLVLLSAVIGRLPQAALSTLVAVVSIGMVGRRDFFPNLKRAMDAFQREAASNASLLWTGTQA